MFIKICFTLKVNLKWNYYFFKKNTFDHFAFNSNSSRNTPHTTGPDNLNFIILKVADIHLSIHQGTWEEKWSNESEI